MAGYQIVIHPVSAKEDWPSLPKAVKNRIGKAVTTKLAVHPEAYGSPLGHSLKNNWKLRVGDYRVIYRIEKNKVIIWTIGHRSIVYAMALKRLIGRLQ